MPSLLNVDTKFEFASKIRYIFALSIRTSSAVCVLSQKRASKIMTFSFEITAAQYYQSPSRKGREKITEQILVNVQRALQRQNLRPNRSGPT